MAVVQRKNFKIYISGPITGTTDYMERFKEAEELLSKCKFIPVNPAKVNSMLPEETSYEEYMKMSEVMLDMCDNIFMLKGWRDSKGANWEHGYAVATGKFIFYEEEE